jgi:hypothetical protein
MQERAKLIAWSLFLSTCCSIGSGICHQLATEGDLDQALTLRRNCAVLENQQGLKYPFCSFQVTADYNGAGHLRGQCAQSSEYKRPLAELPNDPASIDWTERMSFLQPGIGWTMLSLDEAKKLWGDPVERIIFHRKFYTFDAHSKYLGEEDIFYLDLEFDDRKLIKAYRVRGIALSNPKWIGPRDPSEKETLGSQQLGVRRKQKPTVQGVN